MATLLAFHYGSVLARSRRADGIVRPAWVMVKKSGASEIGRRVSVTMAIAVMAGWREWGAVTHGPSVRSG
jgi:hypothetical protein